MLSAVVFQVGDSFPPFSELVKNFYSTYFLSRRLKVSITPRVVNLVQPISAVVLGLTGSKFMDRNSTQPTSPVDDRKSGPKHNWNWIYNVFQKKNQL